MKNFASRFLAALVAVVLLAPAASIARTVTVPVTPAEPASLMRIEYALGVWQIASAKTAATIAALADSVAAAVRSGKNVAVALQATADVVPYPNGDLVARRLGYVSQIFARAGVPENRMRQSILTETAKGERYVRIWLYPAGFSTVTVEIPDIDGLEARVADVERRLDAGESDRAIALDLAETARLDAAAAWVAVDRVVDLAVGVGGAYQSQPGAFGPALTTEIRFSPDPGLPVGLVAHGSVGLLSSSPNWGVGGGVGLWGDRVGLSLQYRRVLYAPYQQMDAEGGVAQAYKAHGHAGVVALDARIAGRLWLRAEGLVGAGYALEGNAASRGTLGGGSVAMMYNFF